MKRLALPLAAVLALTACTTAQRSLENPHPRLSKDESERAYDDEVLVTADGAVAASDGIEETELFWQGTFAGEANFFAEL